MVSREYGVDDLVTRQCNVESSQLRAPLVRESPDCRNLCLGDGDVLSVVSTLK